jgi:hypothetical protein
VSLGILVDGDNHFIVRGPLPSADCARALAREWSLIRIGSGVDMTQPVACRPWRVSTREFRENLQWAVIVPSVRAIQPAVQALLEEISTRGVALLRAEPGASWAGEDCR